MKKAILFLVMVSVLVLASSSWAFVFTVDKAPDLRTALTTAAGNGENDTINIAAGTYIADVSPFSYTPSLVPPEENFSLSIVGVKQRGQTYTLDNFVSSRPPFYF